jgi:hypothetical protein
MSAAPYRTENGPHCPLAFRELVPTIQGASQILENRFDFSAFTFQPVRVNAGSMKSKTGSENFLVQLRKFAFVMRAFRFRFPFCCRIAIKPGQSKLETVEVRTGGWLLHRRRPSID